MTGRVTAVWRYPVKSFRGESVPSAGVGPLGLDGDRLYGFRDLVTGLVLSAKRHPALLQGRARLDGDAVIASFPGAQDVEPFDPRLAAAVGDAVGAEVEVVRADEWDEALWIENTSGSFTGMAGRLVDARPILIVSTHTLATLSSLSPGATFDARRFRPNLVVEMDAREEEWIGRDIAVGDSVLRVERSCGRCTIVSQPQDELPHDPEILRTVAQHTENKAGVYAALARGGEVRVGDEVGTRGP